MRHRSAAAPPSSGSRAARSRPQFAPSGTQRIGCPVSSGSRGTFEKAGDAYKVPAFAVTHSGIGYALEDIYALFHTVEEFMWLGIPYLFHAGPLYLQEEAVKLFPHLRADLLTHLPRIFACSRDTGHN